MLDIKSTLEAGHEKFFFHWTKLRRVGCANEPKVTKNKKLNLNLIKRLTLGDIGGHCFKLAWRVAKLEVVQREKQNQTMH